MDIVGVQGMTRLNNLGIIATILILAGVATCFLDAPSVSANSENSADYQDVAFDSLSAHDLELIVAVKNGMKVSAQ